MKTEKEIKQMATNFAVDSNHFYDGEGKFNGRVEGFIAGHKAAIDSASEGFEDYFRRNCLGEREDEHLETWQASRLSMMKEMGLNPDYVEEIEMMNSNLREALKTVISDALTHYKTEWQDENVCWKRAYEIKKQFNLDKDNT